MDFIDHILTWTSVVISIVACFALIRSEKKVDRLKTLLARQSLLVVELQKCHNRTLSSHEEDVIARVISKPELKVIRRGDE